MHYDYFRRWMDLDNEIIKKSSNELMSVYVPSPCYNDIFITSNIDNVRIFSIAFDKNIIKDYKIQVINGVSISVKENKQLDPTKIFLVFENESIEMDNAFIAFSTTIMSNIEYSKSDLDTLDIIERTLNEYHNFFSFKKQLSKEVEQGLFSELNFLDYLIDNYSEETVINWCGPEKNKRDFIFDRVAVEIKSTKNQKQIVVHISNENQLQKMDLDNLYLRVYLIDVNDAGKKISYYINKIKDKITKVHLKKMFLTKISMYNIDPLTYDGQYSFRIEAIKTYEVNDVFPKITRDNIPSECSNVNYNLNITNIRTID